ncbi:MAG TPA: hypothetical protein VKX25_09975 [Bryobacteraceae bacterium]|jgi:hypothetical protein|nr:hypothetical protein [Bryobacteraceae bacterium]
MNTAKVELTDYQGLKDLKPILGSPGPCLSAYMTLAATAPNQNGKTNALEWRELVRSLEAKQNGQNAAGRELIESIGSWETLLKDQPPQGKAIAVFRSPEVFQICWLQRPVTNRVVFGPHFYIRPLLSELTRGKQFYILALSQKDVRLLRCTLRSAEEVALPAGTVTSFDAYMHGAKPDHVRVNVTSAGASGGHTKGATGTTDTEREDKPEYLAHFFRQLDRGVNELLRNNGDSAPVVLAGVERELAQYKTINTYPRLVEESVQGAPNSLKSGEMHARAIEALGRDYDRKVDTILAEYDHKVGGGASNKLKDVVTAAHDGRVLSLLVSDSLEHTGAFDERTHSAHGRPNGNSDEEDLVNDAAVQTILHAGQVYCVPNKKMPNGAPAAAVFRY